MATLINGNGNNAVYAQQDADLYAGALGESTRILNVGSKLAYTIEDANTIAVADGVILTKEGRRIQVDVGSVDEFTIPTGSAGVTRYYIIGYHLYTDGSANQKCETFVQLMASESETIPEAEFREGATEVYVSLYRIKQIGLNLDTITALLSVGIALTDMTDVIGDTDISGIGDGTLTGGLNAVNQNLTELNTFVSGEPWQPVLLWTNPSPSSSFAAQTINVDLSAHSFILMEFSGDTSNDASNPIDIRMLYKADISHARMTYIDNCINYRVISAATNSTITFNEAHRYGTYAGSASTDNSKVVPLRIWGLN